jgi:hypothetical protein
MHLPEALKKSLAAHQMAKHHKMAAGDDHRQHRKAS